MFTCTRSTLQRAAVTVSISCAFAFPSMALAQSFKDLPADHPAYEAVEYLKAQGVISGYADGTFQPGKKVNRAEALKIILGPLVTQEQIAASKATVYSDVGPGAWYSPYVEIGRVNGVIDGPPKKTAFLGENAVIKVEFLKMMMLANKLDPNTFGEVKLPLASDVTNPDDWFYPYLRYAITASMTMIGTDGLLHPAQELTRGETALLLYRFLMYREGRRTQALLSEAETEILVVLGMLEQNDIVQAEYASARALLAARGAHASKPDEPIVQGALKVAEAFRALVRGYRNGLSKNYEEVIRLAGDAWNLAAKAKELAPGLSTVTDQVQTISKNMADSARTLMAAPQ